MQRTTFKSHTLFLEFCIFPFSHNPVSNRAACLLDKGQCIWKKKKNWICTATNTVEKCLFSPEALASAIPKAILTIDCVLPCAVACDGFSEPWGNLLLIDCRHSLSHWLRSILHSKRLSASELLVTQTPSEAWEGFLNWYVNYIKFTSVVDLPLTSKPSFPVYPNVPSWGRD